MRRCALALWLGSLAVLAGVGVVVCGCGVGDAVAARLGTVAGLVALVGGTAGCVAVCAEK